MAVIKEERATSNPHATSTVKLDSPIEEKQQLDYVPPQQLGSSWRDEVHEIPKQRSFALVYICLGLSAFLGALDQTIVSTALSTISRELGGAEEYAWVGSAYMLLAACSSPLYGKLADIFGRKPILLGSIGVFILGSALCGAAQNMTWLVVCRGLQGVGGGGIMQLVSIIVADITSLQDRGKYAGGLASVWGIASACGPALAGVIVNGTTWRWCFYINLPTGGFCAICLFFCLNVPRSTKKTFREHFAEFDYAGMILLLGGTAALLVGLNNGATDWHAASAVAPLTIGAVFIVAGLVNECFTKQSPLIPPRLFQTRTTVAILVSSFLQSIAFLALVYYLPLYYQILGNSPLMAGVRTLPLTLTGSLMAVTGGMIVGQLYHNYKHIMMAGLGLMTLGLGTMITLDAYSSFAAQFLTTFFTALGMGVIFSVPAVALQAAMPHSAVATALAGFGLVRTLGSAMGTSIAQSIYGTELSKRTATIPEFEALLKAANVTTGALNYPVADIINIQPEALRQQVMQQFSLSIRLVWIILVPIVGLAFLATFFLKVYSLKDRKTVRVDGKGTESAATTKSLPRVSVEESLTVIAASEKREAAAV